MEDKKTKKGSKKLVIIIAAIVIAVVAVITVLFNPYAIKGREYKNAIRLAEAGEYAKAIGIFKDLGDYKESKLQVENYTIVMQREMYEDAIALMGKEDYTQAEALFLSLGDYKDAPEQMIVARKKAQTLSRDEINVGDTISFGVFEQDNKPENGAEELEWIVLDKKQDKALVITKNVLTCMKYHATFMDVTWETCSSRAWLNKEFLKESFLEEQQAKILEVTNTTEDNPKEGTEGGKDTLDKIFFLSVAEVNKYFPNVEDKMCKPTQFAIARGSYQGDNECAMWWLRTPGGNSKGTCFVSPEGEINFGGYLIDYRDCSIRPAMWVKLDK